MVQIVVSKERDQIQSILKTTNSIHLCWFSMLLGQSLFYSAHEEKTIYEYI